MTKVLVPPIKCQGIKTKLVPLILANVQVPTDGVWIEPFMGSGVVGINAKPRKAIFADLNPHVVSFYQALFLNQITPEKARAFLTNEGKLLKSEGQEHYYAVRERFNRKGDPLDFLFLSRACFNGMIRFNSKGGFNVPFCRKPNRFCRAYTSKIVNQIAKVQQQLQDKEWTFISQDFERTIEMATENDFIYCDPPYLGRHVDYFNSWNEDDEHRLSKALSRTRAKFILSTWHSNKYRKNETLDTLWTGFHMVTKEHFYHVGASETNRNSMLEALVMNFVPPCQEVEKKTKNQRSFLDLLDQTGSDGLQPAQPT